MKYLARMTVIIATCLAVASVASAVDPSKPFIVFDVPDGGIDLGVAYGPGWRQLGGQVVGKVTANCPYHIEASFEGLKHARSRVKISPNHLQVAINGQNVAVGTGHVPIATSNRPTSASGKEVPIDLRLGVTGLTNYPPGAYGGVVVITITPVP